MAGVNPKFLISAKFSRHTKAALNLDDDVVLTYYIDDFKGRQTLEDGRTIKTLPHTAEEVRFIEKIFDDMDPLLAIDFKRARKNKASDIDIYSVVNSSDWRKDDLGEVADQKSKHGGTWWDVLWRDTDGKKAQNDSDLYTIIHEIGHSLGLSHPKEKPYSRKWDSSDTVMSYNKGPNGWDTNFSSSDLQALQAIWGSKDGSVNLKGFPGNKIKEFFGTRRDDDIVASRGDDDVFGLRGDDIIEGLTGDDVLYGDAGDDLLIGGKGHDVLDGARGENTLKGGQGEDRFVIDVKGYQIIQDFSLKQDELWIVKGSKTYWNWDWEYDGNRTYIFDRKSGDDIAELKGRHNLENAYLYG